MKPGQQSEHYGFYRGHIAPHFFTSKGEGLPEYLP